MDKIKISTAQFENRSGDKGYNLSIIENLAEKASFGGSQVIAFHECSVTGYSFARHLSRQELLGIAEIVPDGPSIKRLVNIALSSDIVILAGLFEKDENEALKDALIAVCLWRHIPHRTAWLLRLDHHHH